MADHNLAQGDTGLRRHLRHRPATRAGARVGSDVIWITRATALKVASHGVRINALVAGTVDTLLRGCS
jgi:NAD(P)-dependent dehydrogenase (short-subunit alcohol dehydrogenase family)